MEAFVALLIAVLILAVLTAPVWLIKLGAYGGLGFAIYATWQFVKWLVATLRAQNRPTP